MAAGGVTADQPLLVRHSHDLTCRLPSLAWQVALEGTSRDQQLFIEEHVGAISAEGGRPVLVLDGAPYPPKADEVASRLAKRDEAERAAQRAELAREATTATAVWKRAARPQEPFFAWLLEWCRAKHVAYIVAPYEARRVSTGGEKRWACPPGCAKGGCKAASRAEAVQRSARFPPGGGVAPGPRTGSTKSTMLACPGRLVTAVSG